MNQDRFVRLRELFDAAAELDRSDQEAFLTHQCPDDEELRLQVLRLLSNSGHRLESFGNRLKGLLGSATEDKLGPYTLLHPIGEGGMGDVWLASQEKPLRRRVALKVVKPGFDSRQVIGRFELERQTLAMMNHPSIAKVFDAGSTPMGRPYFVMEYVEGKPITVFCDEHKYTVNQRVTLLHQVCQAVQHAHRKGVIHRDLKPSNILVSMIDGCAVAKIIDFGIAKVMHGPLSGATQFTELHKPIGTPEYMSPEQFDPKGSDIDVRSDVYALGVVLFELLTGSTPVAVTSDSDSKSTPVIQTRPSTVIEKDPRVEGVAKDRDTSSKRLSSIVRGDLDWIALKTLAPEPDRRYESVTAFLNDLSAFLEARPITARSPSVAYLAHRFVSRHRVFAASAVTVILAAIVVLISTQFALNKARESEAKAVLEARRSSHALELLVSSFNLTNPMEGGSRELTARQVLDAGVARLDEMDVTDDEIKTKLRTVLGRAYNDLAYYEVAEEQLQKALLEAKEIRDLMEVRQVLASLYWARGPVEKAETLQRQVFQDQLKLHGRIHPETLEAQAFLAGVLLRRDKLTEAKQHAEFLIEAGPELGQAGDSSTIQALSILSSIHLQNGDIDHAETYARRAYERNRVLHGENHIITRGSEFPIASILRRQGRYDEAELVLEDLEQYAYDLWGPDHKGYFRTLEARGNLERARGDFLTASDYFARAKQGFAQLLEPNHPDLVRVAGRLESVCKTISAAVMPNHCTTTPQEGAGCLDQQSGC